MLLFQLEQKQVVPPFKPNISGEFGLDNFDAQFTNEPIQLTPDDEWVHISCALLFILIWLIYDVISRNWCHKILFLFVPFSDVVKKIDQSEFEGFEYINPLLMSAEECVWGTPCLCPHAPPTHTPMHVLRGVSVSSSCMVTREPGDIHLLFEGRTCTVERLFAKTSVTLCQL